MVKGKGPGEMMEAMLRYIPEKTGRTLEGWLLINAKCDLTGYKQRVDWLKKKHGITHGFALVVVNKAKEILEGGPKTDADLIDEQSKGDKAHLRPIYEKLVKKISELIPETEILPRKTCVTLAIGKKFGTVQASTRSRLDVGLRIPDVVFSTRLVAAKNFDMNQMTSQVSLTCSDQIDNELSDWIKMACEARK